MIFLNLTHYSILRVLTAVLVISYQLEKVVLAVLAKFKPDSKLKTKLKGGLSKLNLYGD